MLHSLRTGHRTYLAHLKPLKKILSLKSALRTAIVAGCAGVGFVGLSYRTVETAAADKLFNDPHAMPRYDVGLVLGCAEYIGPNRKNLYFRYRIQAAVAAYQAGAVNVLLVSGDNSRVDYDEPTAMKQALIRAGVPAKDIVCDYAGFSTLDSIIRAKHVFGAERLCVISQPFHAKRAVYLSQHHGIEAIALTAQDVHGRGGFRTQAREYAARVKAVLDIAINQQPRFLGPPVSLSGNMVAAQNDIAAQSD